MAWLWPVRATRITQLPRRGHTAFDVGVPTGTPVMAPVDAVVERVVPMDPSGYGNLVVLRTGDGHRIYLAHLSRFAARPGQQVRPGQVVGYSGSTGRSTGPHLHLEVRSASGSPVSPWSFFDTLPLAGLQPLLPGAPGQLPPGYSPTRRARPTRLAPVRQTRSMQPVRYPAATVGSMASTPGLLANVRAAAGSTAGSRQPGTPLIYTPLGPISLAPRLPWATLGTFTAGLILVFIAVYGLVTGAPARKQAGELVREVGPEVAGAAGAIHPALGVALGVAAAKGGKKGRTRAAGRAIRTAIHSKPKPKGE